MTKALSNIAASVRQRLLNIAKERSEDFQRILGRYFLQYADKKLKTMVLSLIPNQSELQT